MTALAALLAQYTTMLYRGSAGVNLPTLGDCMGVPLPIYPPHVKIFSLIQSHIFTDLLLVSVYLTALCVDTHILQVRSTDS